MGISGGLASPHAEQGGRRAQARGTVKPIRVLIADDDPSLRSALADLVDSEETLELVGSARDAEEAIQLAQTRRPDVALVDVRMPAGGGVHAAREIRARSPETRVIALSAFEDRATVFDMLRAGARGYLVKGTSSEEIVKTIRRATYGQAALSAQVTADVIDELAGQLERQEQEGQERRERVERIRAVLAGEALGMVFQPIFNLSSGDVVGVEALTRFAGPPERPPDAWFREAWEVGLGIDLELTALRTALPETRHLPDGPYISVNLSPETAISPRFMEALGPFPAERFVVEVTEHAAVEDYDALGRALQELRQRGGRLAIDDAGSGFASLRHILRLAPEIIKLDITLTRDIDTDRVRRALASALTSFASEIGASIVAEGIETQAELDTLRALGVGYAQGYYLARPGPLPLSALGSPKLRPPGAH
jgi:EAL domain-containing protein (putative c-di-GMP-specific phosphodiesterase class I)/CheY-like chemotaxis protein